MSKMNEAPERIWAWRQTTITRWSGHGEGKDTTEYVRADLFDAKDKCIAELEAKLAKAQGWPSQNLKEKQNE